MNKQFALFRYCSRKIKKRGIKKIDMSFLRGTHHSESKFSWKSAVVTYARNVKKDSFLSELTDLIVVPSPTSSKDIGFFRLSLFFHVILRVLLRAKTSTRLTR